MSLLARLGLGGRNVRVAPVTHAHSERLARIHGGAFARPWTAEEFDAFLTDESVLIDGLFFGRDSQPSGFVVSRAAADEAEILSVALSRPVRGRGCSQTLLRQHLQKLAHRGVRIVHLEVEEGNHPALALYRRIGFAQTGRRPGYYARPDGTRASALSMSLLLGNAPSERTR